MCFLYQKNDNLSKICVHEIIILQADKRSQRDLDDLLHKREEFILILVEWAKRIDMLDVRVQLVHQVDCENLS